MSQYNNTNSNSAFYSGPTRYGGAAAVAKRREAARKAFFAVKEVPPSSSSSRPSTFNLVNTYTINNDNIIRREPNVPQLTSHAQKILSWIEENSVQITKMKQTRQKHRFNPMAYRAPVSISKPASTLALTSTPQLASAIAPQLQPAPALTLPQTSAPAPPAPTLSLTSAPTAAPTPSWAPTLSNWAPVQAPTPAPTLPRAPVQAPKLPPTPAPVIATTKTTTPTPAPVFSLKSSPIVEPPQSLRFAKVKFCGSTEEIRPETCKRKEFSTPVDLNPPKNRSIVPTKKPVTTATETKTATAIPTTAATTTTMATAATTTTAMSTTTTSTTAMSTTTTSAVFSLPTTTSLPLVTNNFPLQMSNFKPSSVFYVEPTHPAPAATPTPTPTPAPVFSLKSSPVVEPPQSLRFAKVIFCGSTKEIKLEPCKKKEFSAPVDLSPPKVGAIVPNITAATTASESKTATALSTTTTTTTTTALSTTTTAATIMATATTTTMALSTKPTAISTTTTATSAVSSPPTTTSQPTATNNFSIQMDNSKASPVLDVDMEMDIDPPAAGHPPTAAQTTTAPTSASSMPPVQQSSGPPPVVSAPVTAPAPVVATQPLFMPPPSFSTSTFTLTAPVTSPAPVVATQPLFMPPPSFTTPTFVPSPVPSSMPNGSNPFQPTSSTRGRKILRPARRLNRQ